MGNNETFFKKLYSHQIIISLTVILIFITVIYCIQSPNISIRNFFIDIFPELFGILFSFLTISYFLIIVGRTNIIANKLFGIENEEKEKSIINAANVIKESVQKLEVTEKKIISTIRKRKLKNDDESSISKLKENSNFWYKWREDLIREDHDYSEALSNAWKELIEAHLDLENKYLKDKKIKNTSESFTLLFRNITKFLYDEYIVDKTKARLKRYHVTGMLPEEFFNGPQIEYTNLSSTPILFSHAFEGEKYNEGHYESKKNLKDFPMLDVQRCIVVRKPNPFLGKQYNALSSIDDLKHQKSLLIKNTNEKYPLVSLLNKSNENKEGEAERLLLHCQYQVNKLLENKADRNLEFIENIIDFDSFKYTSIVHENKTTNRTNYVPLFEYFSTYFSRTIDDTFFHVIDGELPQKNLQSFFKPGYMPEIILFGLDENGDGMENKWLLGLKGQYKPFSREIEIEILKPYDVTLCADDIIDSFFIKKLNEL